MQRKYSISCVIMLAVCFVTTVNAQIIPAGAVQVNTAAGTKGVFQPASYGGSIPVNYIRTWLPLQPYTAEGDVTSTSRTVNQVNQATQYIDGLGRSLQMVNWQTSPAKKDIVAPVVYDILGREGYKYLPYTSSGDNGSFKADPFGDQAGFYGSTYLSEQPALRGEQYFYGRTVFENSPLSRPLKTFAPGNNWAGSEGASGALEHAVQIAYASNTASDEVRLWTIGYNADITVNVPASTTYYDAGELYKTTTQDELGKQVIEYKDKEGHVVLKKVQIDNEPSADAHTGWLCTYYVYDDLGQLRFVLPPKAVNAVIGNSWAIAADVASELCFGYEYDSRNRMIGKKVPGAAWVYLVYDMRDRLAFTQDGNMRVSNWWLTSLYDNLNRLVETAMMTGYTGTREQLQEYVNGVSDGSGTLSLGTGYSSDGLPADLLIDQREPGRTGYQATNSITVTGTFETETMSEDIVFEIITGTGGLPFPITQVVNTNPVPSGGTLVPLTLQYYDNYTNTAKTYDNTNNSKLDAGSNASAAETVPSSGSTMTQGLPTSNRTLVLKDPVNIATNNTWLETVSFYDDKGRPVQVQNTNYKGGNDVTTSRYDFSGKPVSVYATAHNNTSTNFATIATKTTMDYDHAGRLIEVRKMINDDESTLRVISNMEYDALGQLKRKKIGQKSLSNTAALEDQQYAYNIRGWLKGINWNYNGSDPTYPGTSIGSDKWFSMDLSYDWGFTSAASQFNGNISGIRWEAGGDQADRAYGIKYDNTNRLLKADFRQNFGTATSQTWANTDPNTGNGSFTVDFSVKMGDGETHTTAYDENGNILKMQQKGLQLNTSPLIDNLTYKYTYNYSGSNTSNTNKLLAVNEDDYGTTNFGLGDFTDRNQSLDDYTYDANGNLTQDKNKNIQSITYNHLNLTYKITVDGKGDITYIRLLAGARLRKQRTLAPVFMKIIRLNSLVMKRAGSVSPTIRRWRLSTMIIS
jgi:hypothetical protein